MVVYANTSAAVKARADWVVTSSIALDVAEHLADQGKKIIWAPDRHLGDYVRRQSGADIVTWDGACIVHEEFKVRALDSMKQTVTVLTEEVEKSKGYIARAEGQAQAQAKVSADTSLLALEN